MRKDVREFIRRLEAAGLTIESTPGHYHVLHHGEPLRKRNGVPFTLPFSPVTTRWRKAALVELRKLGIESYPAREAHLGHDSTLLSSGSTWRGHKTDRSETTRT